MMLVVLCIHLDGGGSVLVHDVEAAKDYIRRSVADGDPPLSGDERQRMEEGLALLSGEYSQAVSGSSAWKETFYVSPLAAYPNPGT